MVLSQIETSWIFPRPGAFTLPTPPCPLESRLLPQSQCLTPRLSYKSAVTSSPQPLAASPPVPPAAAARGKELFQQKCSTCHYDTSDAKKIGPGLKGLNKRGTFTVNNNKVTDENLKTWIENGDSLMPPFKDVIDDNQIKDVIAYVRTL